MWIDQLDLYDIAKEQLTTSDIKEQRKAVCSSCKNLNKVNICDICHCVMPAKWWLAHASCPDNKW